MYTCQALRARLAASRSDNVLRTAARASAVLCLCALAEGVSAQTLEEQYRSFLANECSGLGFERDAEGHVLASQAGPNLASFCFRPPPGPGPIAAENVVGPLPAVSTSITGAGSAAAAGRTSVGLADAALRDRREQSRGKDDPDAVVTIEAAEVELFQTARAAAFVSVDRRFERQDVSAFESGRRAYSVAATLGADYRIGTATVLGFALSNTELSGDFTDGGDFEFDGRGVWVYGSWLLGERAFIDASVGVDVQDRHTRRLVGLTTVTVTPDRTFITVEPPIAAVQGETRSREKGFEVSGGYDFVVGSVTVGPRIGIAKRRVGLNGLVESGPTPMALAFDEQTIRSERTSLGVHVSKALNVDKGALVTQLKHRLAARARRRPAHHHGAFRRGSSSECAEAELSEPGARPRLAQFARQRRPRFLEAIERVPVARRHIRP